MEFNWLFVNDVPLLVPKRNLARQQQVEMWLDLAQIAKELGLTTVTVIPQTKPQQLSYIR
jgi:hypothetical protein